MSDSKSRIDELLPAFIAGACEVFETMVFMPITCGQPTEKLPGIPQGYISGTISINSADDTISGNLSVIFDLPVATKVFQKMMGMDETSPVEPQEVNDVVGELANMIAGGAKSRLQETAVHFKIGLPTVVVGEKHYIEPQKHVRTVVVTITSDAGQFFMELSA